MYRFLLFLVVILLPAGLLADTLTPEQQQRAEILFTQVRCPTCESQSLHDSNTPLANDMRSLIASEIKSGKTDEEILQHLTESYGESILLKPQRNHFLLWGAPLISLLIGMGIIALRRLQR